MVDTIFDAVDNNMLVIWPVRVTIFSGEQLQNKDPAPYQCNMGLIELTVKLGQGTNHILSKIHEL